MVKGAVLEIPVIIGVDCGEGVRVVTEVSECEVSDGGANDLVPSDTSIYCIVHGMISAKSDY